ncbi:MAG: hypothetical protein GPJ54_10725 [Candidatus Heimdallarchaeota archaeon]|nr:hypothetical protein [Candidatus Heimdallarchaeota archaeon]
MKPPNRNISIVVLLVFLFIIGTVNGNSIANPTGQINNIQRTGPIDVGLATSEYQPLVDSSSIPISIQTSQFEPSWIEKTQTINPSARQHSAMAYDSFNDKMILFGGHNGSILGDTWAYDYETNTWEDMNPSTQPSPTWRHAMVYDPDIGKIVMFAGIETWTYDYQSNVWAQQFPQVSPSTKYYHSMVYDTTRRKIMLLGGNIGIFETWEMDSTTFNWTNLSPISPIPLLFAMAASYDQANDKIIVFGGQNSSSAINAGETYAYDYTANQWKLQTPLVDPSDRRFYGKPMGYDIRNEKSVLYGGIGAGGISNETWAFNYSTTTWELISTIDTPLASWLHNMVFNSIVNKFIMFGGSDGSLSDKTFELTAYNPVQIISPGNKYLELGSVSSSISWQLLDPFDGTYEIKLDSQIVDSGNFVDGQTISLVPFGLNLGNYSLEMSVADSKGNSASDLITLYVVEVEPPIIIGPEDMEIEVFDFNRNITWILEDLTPANYTVTQNGTVIDVGNWENGDGVFVNLDTLPLGTHIFEITVTDGYDNLASDVVVVKIVDTGFPTISSPDDVFTTEGTIGNKIVWDVDDDNPTDYFLEVNSEIISNDTYLNIFFISVNLDGYTFGTYNFTLTLYDEDGHSVSDSVEVQIFAISEGSGNTNPPSGGGGGGAANFIRDIDPQVAALGAFVAVMGGAYFVIRRRGSSF